MPQPEGWTPEHQAFFDEQVKERLAREKTAAGVREAALRAELTDARAAAARNEAAAAKLSELTAAQAKAERDKAWSDLDVGERSHVRRLLEQEYDALQVEDGKERPTFSAWVTEQRATAGTLVSELLPVAATKPTGSAAPVARPVAATAPATTASPGAGDPSAAFEARRAAELARIGTLPPNERKAAAAALVTEAKQLAGSTVVR